MSLRSFETSCVKPAARIVEATVHRRRPLAVADYLSHFLHPKPLDPEREVDLIASTIQPSQSDLLSKARRRLHRDSRAAALPRLGSAGGWSQSLASCNCRGGSTRHGEETL